MTFAEPSQRSSDNTYSTPIWTRIVTASAALLAATALGAFAAPRAGAVSDAEELARFGSAGAGAGQLLAPREIGTDPVTGHIFTADNNSRINEFTAWGDFVKAFGWDVAPDAVNEQQEVRLRASTGQFKLTYGASTTTDLAFDAPGSASEGPGSVEAALNALPSIGGAGGEVSVQAVPGTPGGVSPYVYVVVFKGSLAASNVDELAAADGSTPLGGGNPSTGLEVRTRADGTAGGVGLEACTEESGCQKGLNGSGAGQPERAEYLVVDSAGNVYAKEVHNRRVQKFDSAGRFVLMLGGEVNKTTGENICTAASGHECGIGTVGTAPGQFGAGFTTGIALGSGGQLFAADDERIQRFNLQGEFEVSIPVSGETVAGLAFDAVSEDIYATFLSKEGVYKLDSTTGAEISQLAPGGGSIAVDPAGNVYVGAGGGWTAGGVRQYDSGGDPLSPATCCMTQLLPPPNSGNFFFYLAGLGVNAAGSLYISHFGASESVEHSFIRLVGPGPVMFEAPPSVAPTIAAQFATSVERTSAVLGAEINPHFWADTRFYVQYGTGKCSEGDCTSEKPLPPGALLSVKPTGNEVKSSGIFLEGLQPGTTYHYRFVAESTGGGPVRGIGGEIGADGEESTFTTYPAAVPLKADCPNQGFRTGFSAPLPDCRAYEMVSPIDKNNGDIKTLLSGIGYNTALDQSSLDGDKFTYSSFRAFAGPKAGTYVSQYMASRKDGLGWESEAISPAQGHGAAGYLLLDANFKAFSEDLCSGWLAVDAEPVLDPRASEGFRQPYRRDNCGSGDYEALVGVPPTGDKTTFAVEFQGASSDYAKALLRVQDKLTPDAASGVVQTYLASNGELHLVCILPNGLPNGHNCAGGGSKTTTGLVPEIAGRFQNVTNAISADGSRVYWTDAGLELNDPRKVYVRVNPDQEQSALGEGQCTEPDKACTLKVSETVSSKSAEFLGASPDGSRAIFRVSEGVQAGNLYSFDLESGESTLIAKEVSDLLGVSETLSHAYFVSQDEIAGTSGATEGMRNLYLDQEGAKTFIATLSKDDVKLQGFSNSGLASIYHHATVSPDGSHLAFFSTEPLTGYDNVDQVTGQASAEVYLYEAGAAGPVCVSCNPSGARPRGRLLGYRNIPETLQAAAMIPAPSFNLQRRRSLSADGARLFFNSYDALLPRDTNGKADVYQWQAASGAEECRAKGADLYVESSGGCLSLISSGQSPSDSEFLDASASGADVFFTTNSSLLPQDPGLIDIYDARANGGLPGPPEPPGPCQGEACQLGPPPPNDPTPSSASFKGLGDLKPAPRCRKGRVARKGRCVAKKRKANKRHAKRNINRNRGASR